MMFEHCIRCNICTENCPVFRVNKKFPGPKQAGPDAQRFRMDGEESVDSWVELCLQCKRCEVSCPYGVNVSEIILKAQIKYRQEHKKPLTSFIFANTYYMGLINSQFAPLVNRVGQTGAGKTVARAIGISTKLPLPQYHVLTLSRSRSKVGKGERKVVFFYGCYLNFNRPDLGRTIRDMLAKMGIEVVLPNQVCCGLPALGNGDIDTARRFATKNATILSGYIDRGYSVVYACTSCGLALTKDYPGILDVSNGKKVAENTYNVHEYILKLMEEGYLEPEFGQVNMKIAYHIPCHLKAIGIGYPAARLFSMIPGLEYHVLDDNCCGLAGSYGFKTKNEETATELGSIASASILSLEPDALVTDCGACKMQLGHLTGLKTLDPAEVISASLK